MATNFQWKRGGVEPKNRCHWSLDSGGTTTATGVGGLEQLGLRWVLAQLQEEAWSHGGAEVRRRGGQATSSHTLGWANGGGTRAGAWGSGSAGGGVAPRLRDPTARRPSGKVEAVRGRRGLRASSSCRVVRASWSCRV